MCNLKCPGFNNHHMELAPSGYATLSFQPKDFTTLQSLPLIDKGCDSQYAVNPAFAHLWETQTTDEIVKDLVALLPHKQWVHPVTKLPVILSLTGGEPMLNAKWFHELFNHPMMQECKHILIETNGTVPVTTTVAMDINQWLCGDTSRRWTWSISPKLSGSGEIHSKAIKPKAIGSQVIVTGKEFQNQVDTYFKFVAGPNEAQFGEVASIMEEYYTAGIERDTNVWIMPEACTTEQQNEIAQKVANMCMDKGYLFCYRLQNALWGNAIGT
jgi:7-carboxy-7-deazaguanine synthase